MMEYYHHVSKNCLNSWVMMEFNEYNRSTFRTIKLVVGEVSRFRRFWTAPEALAAGARAKLVNTDRVSASYI